MASEADPSAATLTEHEKFFLQLCESNQKGVKGDFVQHELTKVGLDVNDIALVINTLSKKNLIEILKVGDGFAYRAVDRSENSKLVGLDPEDKMVYSHIKASGNQGIWIKTLKIKTNMHQRVVTKCLKTLELKGLIKSVKSVKNPLHKLYMLMEVKPSEDITGGPWFTDQELDIEFVETLTKQCYRFIMQKSVPRSNPNAIFTSSYSFYATPSQLLRFFADAQISTVQLTVRDIQCILDLLVYDGKIEKVTSQFSIGMEDEGDEVMYRAKRSGVKNNEVDAWSHVPCEKCPHLNVCCDTGPISPSSCDFMKRWLQF